MAVRAESVSPRESCYLGHYTAWACVQASVSAATRLYVYCFAALTLYGGTRRIKEWEHEGSGNVLVTH